MLHLAMFLHVIGFGVTQISGCVWSDLFRVWCPVCLI